MNIINSTYNTPTTITTLLLCLHTMSMTGKGSPPASSPMLDSGPPLRYSLTALLHCSLKFVQDH